MGPSSSFSQPDRSAGRYPDGTDSDNNCRDFLLQSTIALSAASAKGSDNIKVGSVEGFSNGQKVIIGTGENRETAVIAAIGTAGATTAGTSTVPGMTAIPVYGVQGFNPGQTITIDSGTNLETAVIASIAAGRRRFGFRSNNPTDTITVNVPLKYAHEAGVQVSGSGITFTRPLTMAHDNGTQVAGNLPTPGTPNKYTRKP